MDSGKEIYEPGLWKYRGVEFFVIIEVLRLHRLHKERLTQFFRKGKERKKKRETVDADLYVVPAAFILAGFYSKPYLHSHYFFAPPSFELLWNSAEFHTYNSFPVFSKH